MVAAGCACLSYGYFYAVSAVYPVSMINAKTQIIFAQIVDNRWVPVNIRPAVDYLYGRINNYYFKFKKYGLERE